MTRVLVCGGRWFGNPLAKGKSEGEIRGERFFVFDSLNQVHRERVISVLIQGGAPGADDCARLWFRMNQHRPEVWQLITEPADWSLGRRAGPLHNQAMLDRHRPELVVSFPGGSGTADMVRRARLAGIEVLGFDPEKAGFQPPATALKSFWVSWFAGHGAFRLGWPWWVSGHGLPPTGLCSVAIICAAIRAESEAAAMEIVYAAHTPRPASIDFRFVEERPDDWEPYSDRFPKGDWMPDWRAR